MLNELNHAPTPVAKAEKGLLCCFDPSLCFEWAQGGLRIFVPTVSGYINYNLVHSVRADIHCDTWRLGKAFAFDECLQNELALTPDGAEWDMALRLSGRPDFIGGYAHGDEVFESISAELDGNAVDVTSLLERTPFQKLCIAVSSTGYDPNDSTTAVLKHWKEYVFDANGVTLHQRVEWLGDYTLNYSYMAMMPPLKTLTDRFYTNADPVPKEAVTHYGRTPHATEAVVYGEESGISFVMSVPRYPHLTGGDQFSMTDNGGRPYNKMYFVLCNGAEAHCRDVWETTTTYEIINKGTMVEKETFVTKVFHSSDA